jgi:inosine triphosphate pyrophosphatase
MSQSDDEIRRKLLKPNIHDFGLVSSILMASYNLKDFKVVKKLDSYDDENFLIEQSNGEMLLCKVHNGVESDDAGIIDYQNSIMRHLNQADGVTTTEPLKSVSGEFSVKSPLPVQSADHSPYPLAVRLLTYIAGTPMAYRNVTPALLVSAGSYLANVDSSLDTFSHAKGKRFHIWCQENTLALRDFTQYIQTDSRRALVNAVIDAFEANVKPKSGDLRRGILQSDFNDANIIIGGNDKIAGVIDFGDSVESWRVLDVTVAMAYAALSQYGKTGHAFSAAANVLRGFAKDYPLTAAEKSVVFNLMCARLACSATLGAYSYAQDPTNKYLLLHAEPCWRTLELFWGTDSQVVDGFFSLAVDGAVDSNDINVPDPDVVDYFKDVRSNKKQKMAAKAADGTMLATFVTGNKGKLAEVKEILKDVDTITLINQKIDLPELQGDPIYVSREKCLLAVKEVESGAVITEDTSLCFNALNGMPGPYIKWFLESNGHDGLNKMLDGFDDKTAYAQTCVAYCAGDGDEEVHVFDGRTNGKIVPPRGPLEFGWDPIFECSEGDERSNGVTYAEMDKTVKNGISHRAKAFEQLKAFLKEREATKKK